MSFMAETALAWKPTFSAGRSPTTQIITILESTVTVPSFLRLLTISSKRLVLSIVMDTPTSEVVIISIDVWYDSKISNTLRIKPCANNIRPDLIFIAVIPSLAATA